MSDDQVPTSKQELMVSHWLQITIYTFPISGVLEDMGRLLCLPFEDDHFGLQLAFCLSSQEEFRLILLQVHPQFLAQWPSGLLHSQQAFRFDHVAEHELRVDLPIQQILSRFINAGVSKEFGHSLQYMEYALQLLRLGVEQLQVPFAPCVVPACRFLAYDSERNKIHKAMQILDQQYDERMSIRELSRKVAINECYLKKGFKALSGMTIHEYIASKRISRAEHMLQEEGKTVTEVAAQLGYSSISHFSTAFKKATGIKPCELLN